MKADSTSRRQKLEIADYPAQRLLIKVEGFSGYFSVPLPHAPDDESGLVTLRIQLPAEAAGLDSGEQSSLTVGFAILDVFDRIADWFIEDLLGIAVGSEGVQVNLSWDAPVDMDLAIIDPDGNLIDFESPSAGTGALNIDSNALCEDGPQVEKISWDNFEEPGGAYQVRVNLFDACGESEVEWKLTASFCGRTVEESDTFTVDDVDQTGVGTLVTTFTVDCTTRVSGKVTYQKQNAALPVGSSTSTTDVPVGFAPVRVVGIDSEDELAPPGLTDANGRYAFAFNNEDEEGYRVEVFAAYADPATGDVRGHVTAIEDDDTYFWRGADLDPADGLVQTQDFDITIADSAGAMNIQAGLRRAYEWIRSTLRSDFAEDVGDIHARWKLDTATRATSDLTRHTSFQRDDELFIDGDPTSRAEWSDSVIAHEFMHFLIRELMLDSLPGGPHGRFRSTPDLAWSEGLATALGQRTLRDQVYRSGNPGVQASMDIETGTGTFAAPGEMFDTDDSRATGRVIEWLVSMIVWDLMDPANETHDRISKEPFSLNVMFEPPPDGDFEDRGDNGVDLVDYIDAFRTGSRNRFDGSLFCLTQERQFPYDRYPSSISCP